VLVDRVASAARKSDVEDIIILVATVTRHAIAVTSLGEGDARFTDKRFAIVA
jgi:hypothetical protein